MENEVLAPADMWLYELNHWGYFDHLLLVSQGVPSSTQLSHLWSHNVIQVFRYLLLHGAYRKFLQIDTYAFDTVWDQLELQFQNNNNNNISKWKQTNILLEFF